MNTVIIITNWKNDKNMFEKKKLAEFLLEKYHKAAPGEKIVYSDVT